MATTTTVSDVQSAFVTAASVEVAAGVKVSRLWSPATSDYRMVFFTDVNWSAVDFATIGGQRKVREERYDAGWEVWWLEEGDPTAGGDAIDSALAIYTACETAVVKAGSTVQAVDGVVSVLPRLERMEPIELGSGWAVVISAQLSVHAYLT